MSDILLDPGYFRLGSVILQIPPTDITTNKVVNDDQISTLRAGSPMFVKSGQARWDVTVHWKAIRVVNSDGTYDYSQWEDIRRVVATFKASPFVEVENDFLRQHFVSVQKAFQNRNIRMAFALKQIRIDTDPDTSNMLDITLTMSLFNYSPFTTDFSYVGDSNDVGVDAIDSDSYNFYLNHWMNVNMEHHPNEKGEPDLEPWDTQEDGTITFKWRKYQYVPFNSPPPQATSNASIGYNPVVPPPKVPSGLGFNPLPNNIQAIVNAAAAKYGIDPAIATAQCIEESGGRTNVVSSSGAIGLFQLVPSTARALGVIDPYDPVQNANGGCKYLSEQLKRFGNYPHALGSYAAGAGYIYAYRDGRAIPSKYLGRPITINPDKIKTLDGLPPAGTPYIGNVPKYVRDIMTRAGLASKLINVPPKGIDGVRPTTPTDTSLLDTPDQSMIDRVNQAIKLLPTDEQYFLDHYTEWGAFFYAEEEITSDAYDLYPNQISIVMVNNLPTIPLAGMQYPIFQHVGPADTMISVSMNSVGDDDGVLNEPEHIGIQALTAMSSQLEDQFHNLRTNFRAISSVHRMQAVFVENQILNMLGIKGTLFRGMNTETIPESSNLVQVSILASQYENVFEQTSPYQIQGVVSAYSPVVKSIVKSNTINTLSKDEQNATAALQQFGNAWNSHNESYLLDKILTLSADSIDYLDDVSTPTVTLPIDRNKLLADLDVRTTPSLASITGSGGLGSSLSPSNFSLAPYLRDKYPGLQKRRLALQGTNTPFTFADYFVFTQLPDYSFGIAPLAKQARNTIEPQFASQKPTILETMYQRLFDYLLITDPLFRRQSTIIANSPRFKDLFAAAITVNGPATQPENVGHTCYKDLGLLDYTQEPGQYFIDHNEILRKNIAGEMESILGVAGATAQQVNQVQSTAANAPLVQAGKLGFTFSSGGETLTGQATALNRAWYAPAYSMNTAFPTFKLLLMEEDNTGLFFAFDNFYSYASVIDIEVIKYQSQPDTAIIKITNLAHALQHRLYDHTAAGKMEASQDRFNVDKAGDIVLGPGDVAGEPGTGGNPNSAIIGGKTIAGTPYQLKNMVEGRGQSYKRVPLKYYALQTGSKIQVRMGYSNNPDNLWPVFTGQVTEIEGDDILTITCQSFQLELLNVPGATVIANNRWGFTAFNSGGAAMGGWALSNAGDTGSVIAKMLTCEAARHFGHFQIGGVSDPLLKGFTWTELSGKLISGVSNSSTAQQVGALLQTGYDRSAENILLNSIINFDATKSRTDPANTGRDRTYDENTSWLKSFLDIGAASYSIPKQSELSAWDIIKDVSRRHPHYNLMVKDYGFPYGADATLVYAHPLDWYYTRPPLYGDAELEKANNVTQGQEFKNWWTSVGRKKWLDIWSSASNLKDLAAILNVELAEAAGRLTALADSGPEGFEQATLAVHQILSGTQDDFAGAPLLSLAGIAKIGQNISNAITHIVTSGNLTSHFFQQIDAQFQALEREWEAHLLQADPAANSSRIKPVRKYHLIDFNHIVHNGITVNDNIYNAVRIMDHAPIKFNQNIPSHHTRILTVTDLINDPTNNTSNEDMKRLYSQSFLREEVGKMYRGELVVRGVPEIEPFDIILLNDPSTGMIGPVEVDTVIHSFTMEEGYITIIKPRLMVIANESVSADIIRSLGFAWTNAFAVLHGLVYDFLPIGPDATVSGSLTGLFGVGALGTAALLAFGVWAPPVAIVASSLALLAGYGIITWAQNRQLDNFFKIQPLSRFGRPWIGGLQGFAISDFAYSIMTGLRWFDAEEIAPTIEAWNEFLHYHIDYLDAR